MSTAVEVGVLGPLELLSDGVRVALGGPKQRLVLGLLAARRGRVVALDDLIDGLWPDGPQARPRKTVQVYVTRLRRALGEQADAIRSEAAGYRFDPALVAGRRRCASRPASAPRRPNPTTSGRSALLRAALGRWRGDAFDDLRDCVDLVPSAVQLDERRLAAMHELFEREVRRRPREILAELEQAVEANPLHEGFAAQLMTAQYRAGRQADALATFRALRRRLGEELGLEPGPAVRELEGRILRHELPAATSRRGPRRARAPAPPGDRRVGRHRRRPADGPVDPEVELALVAPVRRAVRARHRRARRGRPDRRRRRAVGLLRVPVGRARRRAGRARRRQRP